MSIQEKNGHGSDPVKVFLENIGYIPKYWPQGKKIVIDASGLHICLPNVQDTGPCTDELRELLREYQQLGREVRALGYRTVDLVQEGSNRWGHLSVSAFLRGYHQPFEPGVALLPEELSSDVTFMKEEEIITWVRHVIDLPANKLNPVSFGQELENLKRIAGVGFKVTCLTGEKLESENLIGLQTVGSGSVNPPCLYEISWTPNPDGSFFAGLVGKGITFDTGGYSLKPSEYMRSMHSDMGGAATIAGTIAMAAVRGFNKNLKACLCCAENAVSGSAMKVGDIISYPNGVSVEIANTDAEGRLVLADGLLRVGDARYVIDAATLTGAAKMALGRDYNAALAFDTRLSELFEEAALETGEYAWRLPLAKMHLPLVKSSFADITNSASGESLPGATTAAAFLSRFVPEEKHNSWLHVDLSASYQKSPSSTYSVGAKGHGVRSLMHYLEKLAD